MPLLITPDILLRKILADACLNQLPLVKIRENEIPLWEKWEKRRSAKEIGILRRRETRTGQPLGPKGYWAWKKYEFGCWHRPHRIDEAIIEWMSPAWMASGLDPDYITVVASGPFGGMYLVYRNEKCLGMEKDSPFDTREGMLEWMERFSKRESPS